MKKRGTVSVLLLVCTITILGLSLGAPSIWAQPAEGGAARAPGDPYLGANPDHNWIQGFDFQADTTVTVSVNVGAKGVKEIKTEPDGSFNLPDWSGFSEDNLLAAGDDIVASDGVDNVTMTIPNVQTTVNITTNRVEGTAFDPDTSSALEGSRVEGWVEEDWGTPTLASDDATVQADGSFVLDLSATDVRRGQRVSVKIWSDPSGDPSGNYTVRIPFNDIAVLRTNLTHDWIDGEQFPPNTPVTVSVNDGDKGTRYLTTTQWGRIEIDGGWSQGDEANIAAPGDVVKATYGSETVQMTVQDIQAHVNRSADIVSGTGPANTKIECGINEWVPLWNQGDYSDVHEMTITAGGTFSFNYASDAPTHDIVAGDMASLTQFGADGGRTLAVVQLPRPQIFAHPTQDWIRVEGLDEGANVSLEIRRGGSLEVTRTGTADEDLGNGWSKSFMSEEDRPLDVQPGDAIRAQVGTRILEMTVADVTADVDLPGDTVTLNSPAGFVAVCVSDRKDQEGRGGREGDSTGTFVADFADPDTGDTMDLVRGDTIKVFHFDGDAGITEYWPYNAIPTLCTQVDHRWIEGEGFPFSQPVTVTAEGLGSVEATTDTQGGGSFHVEPWQESESGDPSVGCTITATCGAETTQMVIPDFAPRIDLSSNAVTGTARTPEGAPLSGRRVTVEVRDNEWDDPAASESTRVAGDGSVLVNLAPFALVRGQQVQVTLWNQPDGDDWGNRIIRAPYNGIPSLAGDLDHNWVRGWGFTPETSVTIDVNGGAKGSKEFKSESGGEIWMGPGRWGVLNPGARLEPGDRITATIEGEIVADITLQDTEIFVDSTTDRISGTAYSPTGNPLAGRKVRATVRRGAFMDAEEELDTREATVAIDGSFTLDMRPFDLAYEQMVEVDVWHAADGSESGGYTTRAALVQLPTVTSLIAVKTSSNYGTFARFTARVTSNGLPVDPGLEEYPNTATLLESSDGINWRPSATLQWDDVTQTYQGMARVTARTLYQAFFDGRWYLPSVSSKITLTSKAWLSQPMLSVTSPRHNVNFVTTGFLKPRHSGYTRLFFYRRVRGRWVLYTIRSAINRNYSTATKYTLTYRLPYAGSWYVKAYHGDSGHLATWSAVRYFTVR